jgi:hypothetical protein
MSRVFSRSVTSHSRETVARNLLFLNEYNAGQGYTEQEYTEWLNEAGFQECTRAKIAVGNSTLMACKSA